MLTLPSYTYNFVSLAVEREGNGQYSVLNDCNNSVISLSADEHLVFELLRAGHSPVETFSLVKRIRPTIGQSLVKQVLIKLGEHGFFARARRLDKITEQQVPLQCSKRNWFCFVIGWRWPHVITGLIVLSAMMLVGTGLVPISYRYYFWHLNPLVVVLTGYLAMFLLMYKHELAHYVVARAYGLSPKLEISYRWFFLVIETVLPGVYRLPERQRLKIYSAGLYFDLLVFAVLTWMTAAGNSGAMNGWWVGLVRQALLIQLLGIVWQFFFFLKTDLYYVLADWFDYGNLSWTVKHYWRWLWQRLWSGASGECPYQHPHLLQLYLLFMAIGGVFALVRLFFFTIPIWWGVVSVATLTVARTSSISEGAMAFTALTFQLSYVLLLVYLPIRKKFHQSLVAVHP
ncbi:MAG: hypothetical protein V1707_00250 [bacterium]